MNGWKCKVADRGGACRTCSMWFRPGEPIVVSPIGASCAFCMGLFEKALCELCTLSLEDQRDPFGKADPIGAGLEGDVDAGDSLRRRTRGLCVAAIDALERRDDALASSIFHGLSERFTARIGAEL